ncbi:MAG: MFS transporter [Gemmatimonadaceae bacterium]
MTSDVREARATISPEVVQRRTLRLVFATQIIGGVGVAVGMSVGALLAAELASTSVSGLAQSAVVIGAALLAIPATEVVHRRGRRSSLAAAYAVAAVGALIVVLAGLRNSVPLLFGGFFLFGGATAAGMQARYAAVDLSRPELRGRHLSTVVWGTTIGAVSGPNLAALAGASLERYSIPTLAGPFVFSTLLFVLASIVLWLFLRPDPAQVARAGISNFAAAPTPQRHPSILVAARVVAASAPARLGVLGMAIGVMAMAPVHVRSAGHDAAHTLRIVGIVLSLHIAGMYAFAPVIGWLTDRLGKRPVILGGAVLLIAGCAVVGIAGHDATRLALGLTILGMGWSSTMVAGSTVLSESVGLELRASAQGLSDAAMGFAGAGAGALSGVVVDAWGYPTLTALAALAVLPLFVAGRRRLDSRPRAKT